MERYHEGVTVVIKEFLKKKIEMLAVMTLAAIGDVIPIIAIMAGLCVVKKAARFFGFEELAPIKIMMAFSEIFMVILYIATVVLSMKTIYKLFKEGEL